MSVIQRLYKGTVKFLQGPVDKWQKISITAKGRCVQLLLQRVREEGGGEGEEEKNIFCVLHAEGIGRHTPTCIYAIYTMYFLHMSCSLHMLHIQWYLAASRILHVA